MSRWAKAPRGRKQVLLFFPTKVPLAGPDSDVLPNKEGGYTLNYTTIAAMESRNGFIMDAEVIGGDGEREPTVELVDITSCATATSHDLSFS
ncbi:MAG: hypothetical protein ACE5NM_07620 [Sedimentisphaerales bacterium]